jgi:ABC-type transporter Mla subunit MlaD
MESRGTFLRVGLLVVVGAALLIGVVMFLAGNRLREGKKFETYYSESVQGLEIGAAVKYRGVTIGRVTDIGLTSAVYFRDQAPELPNADFRLIFVRFVIDERRVGRLPDTESAIETGLRAKLASQGLTGLSYVELDFVNPKTYPPLKLQWRPEGEYIPSMPSTLTQVQDAVQIFLAKMDRVQIDTIAANLNGLLIDLRGELRDGDAHVALAALTGLLTEAARQVQGADLPALSAELRRTAEAARTLVGGPAARTALSNAAVATDRLARASAQLPALVASLQDTARRAGNGTADLQAALTPILRDMQAAVANLRDTSETLRRYPASTLLGGPPPRPEAAH